MHEVSAFQSHFDSVIAIVSCKICKKHCVSSNDFILWLHFFAKFQRIKWHGQISPVF